MHRSDFNVRHATGRSLIHVHTNFFNASSPTPAPPNTSIIGLFDKTKKTKIISLTVFDRFQAASKINNLIRKLF